MHCVTHEMQLALKDASHDLDYMTDKFHPTLKKLFNFYHYSARRTRNMEEAAENVQLPSRLKKFPQLKTLRLTGCEQRLVEAVITD